MVRRGGYCVPWTSALLDAILLLSLSGNVFLPSLVAIHDVPLTTNLLKYESGGGRDQNEELKMHATPGFRRGFSKTVYSLMSGQTLFAFGDTTGLTFFLL